MNTVSVRQSLRRQSKSIPVVDGSIVLSAIETLEKHYQVNGTPNHLDVESTPFTMEVTWEVTLLLPFGEVWTITIHKLPLLGDFLPELGKMLLQRRYDSFEVEYILAEVEALYQFA